MFPPHGSTPQPPSFPESSCRQLSSYPQLIYSMAPYLPERIEPQEDEEATRYTRYRDTNHLNTDDGDEGEDEDEEEDYLVTDRGDVDTEASNCSGDGSASAAVASTPKLAGKGYDLRTEHSRRSPNRFTPLGWSTKALKQGASGVVKNVSNLFSKKK
ncbi:hypothetical protein PIB30_048921 [Stylosanthes scabra]|uniref:Uncharacterized protein n=1 Tax=Stylosanthes scabra TaxID=79078 RepID=A0ABU6VHZ8_9FABA|nr:hypothetical protein [Stylosanthes scabra]